MKAPEKPTLISNVTGLDMGITHFAIKSDGNKIANPRHLINACRNLRRKQKALSTSKVEVRTVKGLESV
ncbi:TPA: hypothetical protein ACS727_003826 [Providencia alcalifaciens]|uniref:transposase n=1 Tax=Providencia alcalifaciens TaxID=126385 RepID=UPI001CC67FEE|nr:transposase [Providencia alcalifaciens]